MSISLYAASVPVFKQMLTALSGVLAKAEAHATAKKIDPNALLQARLYPDMFPLTRQVQIAGAMARLLSSPREVIHSRRQDIRATSQKPNTGGRDDHENTKR